MVQSPCPKGRADGEAAGAGTPPPRAQERGLCPTEGWGGGPAIHSRGAGAACAWTGAGSKVPAETQSIGGGPCPGIRTQRGGGPALALRHRRQKAQPQGGGSKAALLRPPPAPQHSPRSRGAARTGINPGPPQREHTEPPQAVQQQQTLLRGLRGGGVPLSSPWGEGTPAPPQLQARTWGGDLAAPGVQAHPPYLSMSPPSLSLK